MSIVTEGWRRVSLFKQYGLDERLTHSRRGRGGFWLHLEACCCASKTLGYKLDSQESLGGGQILHRCYAKPGIKHFMFQKENPNAQDEHSDLALGHSLVLSYLQGTAKLRYYLQRRSELPPSILHISSLPHQSPF